MLRVLFLSVYPREAAATRFRITQFFPFLERHGVSCDLVTLLSVKAFQRMYTRGATLAKARMILAGGVRQVIRAASARRYDVVFVQRGVLPFGPPVLEAWLARVRGLPLVYDYDDAIWLQDPRSPGGPVARAARWPWKVAQIVRIARHVIVCNDFTRDFALRYRTPQDVTVIPTVVDSNVFRPPPARPAEVTVGWIGTHSTARYLEGIVEPIREAAARRPFRLKIVGSGREWSIHGVDLRVKPWSLDEEVSDYQTLDVGLYPVADEEWGWGKTGFKPVVYMSSGAVCLASPIGGVTEFLRHGENGLLASSAAEWREGILSLVSDTALRSRLSAAGRQTVLDWYCLHVQAPRLLDVLQRAAAQPRS
jgi:glycosyltransferase involved in cell wall biosynthesis